MASKTSAARFQAEMARQMAEQVVARVRPLIGSRTLAKALTVKVDPLVGDTVVGRATIPHYWAEYYHDGRGPVRAKPGKWLIFFPRIEDDPRVNGGRKYPVQKSDIRKLTRSEFRRLEAENKMIVTRQVGPAKGNPFFVKGVRNIGSEASARIPPAFSAFIRRELAGVLNLSGTVLL